MDAEVVARLMISQQLLSEDIVMLAQSCYHKNCLILEQVRLMNQEALATFVNLLVADDSQKHIGNVLCNG